MRSRIGSDRFSDFKEFLAVRSAQAVDHCGFFLGALFSDLGI
jgi:hypothetical protein